MQYSKWRVIANRHRNPTRTTFLNFMLRTLHTSPFRLLALLLPLGLGACADTISSNQVTSSSELLKDYDKTLTKSEQQAVISDLENAQAKARGETPLDPGSTGAKSAEKQN
jgi:hypothetical protein